MTWYLKEREDDEERGESERERGIARKRERERDRETHMVSLGGNNDHRQIEWVDNIKLGATDYIFQIVALPSNLNSMPHGPNFGDTALD